MENEKLNDLIKKSEQLTKEYESIRNELPQEIKDKMGESISIYKVDVDIHQNIAAHFSVNSVPTLAVFKEGKLIWREPGVKPAAQLVQIISKL